MTITRLWQAGAELNDWSYEMTYRSGAGWVTASDRAKTGTYAYKTSGAGWGNYVAPATYAQVRAGCWLNFSGVTTSPPDVLGFYNGATFVGSLQWDHSSNQLRVWAGATLLDGQTVTAFNTVDTWKHIGVDLKIHASAGWFYVYLNGSAVISYSGKTDHGSSAADTVYFGNPNGAASWTNIWYDNLFFDSTVSESAAAQVPDLQFDFIQPNADNTPNAWTPNSGSTHYDRVNEVAPNGDTTYLEVNTASQEEQFGMANIASLPAGWSIPAVIPVRVGKKQDAGSSLGTQFKLTESGSTANGGTLALTSSYVMASERFASKPSGGAWTEAAVNGLELSALSV